MYVWFWPIPSICSQCTCTVLELEWECAVHSVCLQRRCVALLRFHSMEVYSKQWQVTKWPCFVNELLTFQPPVGGDQAEKSAARSTVTLSA